MAKIDGTQRTIDEMREELDRQARSISYKNDMAYRTEQLLHDHIKSNIMLNIKVDSELIEKLAEAAKPVRFEQPGTEKEEDT
jgi:hypothetical protein